MSWRRSKTPTVSYHCFRCGDRFDDLPASLAWWMVDLHKQTAHPVPLEEPMPNFIDDDGHTHTHTKGKLCKWCRWGEPDAAPIGDPMTPVDPTPFALLSVEATQKYPPGAAVYRYTDLTDGWRWQDITDAPDGDGIVKVGGPHTPRENDQDVLVIAWPPPPATYKIVRCDGYETGPLTEAHVRALLGLTGMTGMNPPDPWCEAAKKALR